MNKLCESWAETQDVQNVYFCTVSPYPGIISSPHLNGVKRPIKVHNIQRDNWVLLTSLNKTKIFPFKIIF